jgi:uncharacterized membrane protein YeaQ/YmgE (transglycosylase-associated protein family)
MYAMPLIALFLGLTVLLALFFLFVLAGTAATGLILLPWLLSGLLVGWIASLLTRARLGCWGNVAIGWAGSLLGGIAYTALTGQRATGLFSLRHIIVGVVGAIFLIVVMDLITGRSGQEV